MTDDFEALKSVLERSREDLVAGRVRPVAQVLAEVYRRAADRLEAPAAKTGPSVPASAELSDTH